MQFERRIYFYDNLFMSYKFAGGVFNSVRYIKASEELNDNNVESSPTFFINNIKNYLFYQFGFSLGYRFDKKKEE